MKKTIAIIILLGILAGSFLLRKEKITNAIPENSVNHVFLLTTLEIWNQYGAANFNYSPVQTYQNSGDKFITYYKRLEDKSGNNYYVSFPPFAFIFSYFIIKLTSIPPQQSILQAISLFLHFISALLIYGICNKLFNKRWFDLYTPSLFGFAAYLFIPFILQMHTWNYFAEMHGQTALVFALYTSIILLNNHSLHKSRLHLILLLSSIVILIYSEWVGVFYVFSFFITLYLLKGKIENYRKIFVLTMVVSFIAIVAIVLQYSSINDFDDLLHAWKIRVIERSGFFGENFSLDKASYTYDKSYLLLINQLHGLLSWFGYLMFALLAFIMFVIRPSVLFQEIKKYKWIVVLLLLPSFMHLVIFFNANVLHYSCMAKFGIAICVGLAATTHLTMMSLKRFNSKAYGGIVCIIVGFSMFDSMTKLKAPSTEFNAKNAIISEKINSQVNNNQCIFVEKDALNEIQIIHLTYLCKRNMQFVQNIDDAIKTMQKLNKKQAILIKNPQKTEENQIIILP